MNAIDLYAGQASANYDDKLAGSLALLQSAATQFEPLTQANSLGAEDMVVSHLLNRAGITCDIFVLDTGKLHPQTLALMQALPTHFARKVRVFRPDETAAQIFVETNGDDAMYRSIDLRKACCHIRKMEPLARALAGYEGWITGLRREQSDARADVAPIERGQDRAKINPLADWTWGDVWHYIAANHVPYHPLHDEFYPSIGCAPCTRAISIGEDFRAGRWWWEQADAKECGLHAEAHGQSVSAIPIREIHA